MCHQMEDIEDSETGVQWIWLFFIFSSNAGIFSSFRDDLSNKTQPNRTSIVEKGDENKMFVCDASFTAKTSEIFERACVNSRAQKAVIGKLWAQLYCNLLNECFRIAHPKLTFGIGKQKHPEIGILNILVLVSDTLFVEIKTDVVAIDVQFLLCLGVMTMLRSVLDFYRNRIT